MKQSFFIEQKHLLIIFFLLFGCVFVFGNNDISNTSNCKIFISEGTIVFGGLKIENDIYLSDIYISRNTIFIIKSKQIQISSKLFHSEEDINKTRKRHIYIKEVQTPQKQIQSTSSRIESSNSPYNSPFSIYSNTTNISLVNTTNYSFIYLFEFNYNYFNSIISSLKAKLLTNNNLSNLFLISYKLTSRPPPSFLNSKKHINYIT